jgi:hypothetical protein
MMGPNSQEAATDASEASGLPPRELPPLRIHHIMLWTAATAGMLSVLRLIASLNGGGQPFVGGPLEAAVMVVYSTLVSGCVVISALLWRWSTQRHFIDQPGQRLAIDIALRAIGMLVLFVAALAIQEAVILLLIVGIISIVVIQCAMTAGLAPRWQWVFGTKAALLGGTSLLQVAIISEVIIVVLVFILVGYSFLIVLQLVGIFWDRRLKLTRHWTHWFGLLAHLGINLMSAVLLVAAIYSFRLLF